MNEELATSREFICRSWECTNTEVVAAIGDFIVAVGVNEIKPRCFMTCPNCRGVVYSEVDQEIASLYIEQGARFTLG